MGENEEIEAIQVRCHSNCLRSALTALIFSSIIFSIISPLERIKEFGFLKKYYENRYLLNVILQDLEGNLCWSSFANTEEGKTAIKQWPLEKFLEWDCRYPLEIQVNKQPEKKISSKVSSKIIDTQNIIAPKAPEAIRVSQRLWQFRVIPKLIADLYKTPNLDRAREFSWEFYGPIRRWENLVQKIFSTKNPKGWGIHAWKSKFIKEDIILAETSFIITRDSVLKYLTMNDIKTISEYEMPNLKLLESKSLEMNKITLPSFGSEFTIISGSFLILLVICIVMLYFFVFQLEAQRWPKFPLKGTIFSITHKNIFYMSIFMLIMTIPAIASTLLAYKSVGLTLLNIIPASFTIIISILLVINQIKQIRIISKRSLPNLQKFGKRKASDIDSQ